MCKDSGIPLKDCRFGIVDTACNTSVVGEDRVAGIASLCDSFGLIWERLPEREGVIFRWGGGKSSKTVPGLRFTALIAGRPFQIKADVVPGDMELLLSLDTLGKIGVLVDCADKSILMRSGKELVSIGKTLFNSAGHMVMDLFQLGDRCQSAFLTTSMEKVVVVVVETGGALHRLVTQENKGF